MVLLLNISEDKVAGNPRSLYKALYPYNIKFKVKLIKYFFQNSRFKFYNIWYCLVHSFQYSFKFCLKNYIYIDYSSSPFFYGKVKKQLKMKIEIEINHSRSCSDGNFWMFLLGIMIEIPLLLFFRLPWLFPSSVSLSSVLL